MGVRSAGSWRAARGSRKARRSCGRSLNRASSVALRDGFSPVQESAMNPRQPIDRLDHALALAQAQIHLVLDLLHSAPPQRLSIDSDHLIGALLALSGQLATAQNIADTELAGMSGLKAARPNKDRRS